MTLITQQGGQVDGKEFSRRALVDPDASGQFLRYGPLVLDRYDRSVTIAGGEPIELTRSEFKLLEVLMRNGPCAVSRDVLLANVFSITWECQTNRLDVLVSQLRRKIGAGFVVTVRGLGYALKDLALGEA